MTSRAVSISTSNLLAPCTDPDGDALTLVSVGSGTNGATVVLAAGLVTYTSRAGYVGADQFPYTISDGHGGTATGYVAVDVYPGTVAKLNVVSSARSGTNFVVTFAGIPGRTYQVWRASQLTGPWTQLAELVATAAGFTSLTDTNTPAQQAFYRVSGPR